MPAKLKVFVTSIGFHDAYVAAPSRAAALRAWGASTDLFAMGAAEQITDEKRMQAALAKPGEVVRQSRGSEADHLSAASARPNAKGQNKANGRVKRRPSRSKLDKAEKALANASERYATIRNAFEEEMTAIRRKQEAAAELFAKRRSKLEVARDVEAKAYDRSISSWRAE